MRLLAVFLTVLGSAHGMRSNENLNTLLFYTCVTPLLLIGRPSRDHLVSVAFCPGGVGVLKGEAEPKTPAAVLSPRARKECVATRPEERRGLGAPGDGRGVGSVLPMVLLLHAAVDGRMVGGCVRGERGEGGDR